MEASLQDSKLHTCVCVCVCVQGLCGLCVSERVHVWLIPKPSVIKAGTDRDGQTAEDTASRRWMQSSRHISRLPVRETKLWGKQLIRCKLQQGRGAFKCVDVFERHRNICSGIFENRCVCSPHSFESCTSGHVCARLVQVCRVMQCGQHVAKRQRRQIGSQSTYLFHSSRRLYLKCSVSRYVEPGGCHVPVQAHTKTQLNTRATERPPAEKLLLLTIDSAAVLESSLRTRTLRF